MPLFKSKKRDNDLSDAIGISHAICDDVLACGRGVQAAVFEIKGASYVTEMPSKLELSLAGFNHFLTRMPSGITLTAVCHREKETSSLKTGIKNAQARAFDAAYQRDIGKKLYKNCWYLHLVVEPQLLGQGHGSLAGKINKLSSNLGGMVSRQTEATTRLLNEVAAQLMSHLSAYSPVRLSLTGARNMLSVLMLPLNAGQHILCSSSKVSSKVGQNHKDALSNYLKYQQGHLVSAYAREGIYFGRDTLVYEDCTNRRIYGAILYIKNHASAMIPPTFDEIYHAPCEFIILHTYSPYTSSGAIKACRDRKRQIENNKEDAHTQVHSVTEIVDAVHENVLGLGDYIQGFFVFGATKPELEENITLLRDRAQKVSVGLVREKIGLEEKFFSQFPGLKSLAPRVEVINSKNFVDMANFHNEDAGHAGDNHLKSAVAILETPAKSLAWFNCHASGEASNPALGHTLMLGGSGGGKTVMLGFLMNQLQRFNGRLWVFDRNQGLEIAVRALGGQYAVLSADNMPKLNPFLLPDTCLLYTSDAADE